MSAAHYYGGVSAVPEGAGLGEELHIIYSGLLFKDGADRVYMHVGYGPGQRWTDIRDFEMKQSGRGWEVTMPVYRAGSLNFCFRDRANNWDNNSGRNWSYQIDSNRFKH